MYIMENPFIAIELESHHFKLLERFTVVLYDKTSQLSTVNESRRELFSHRDKVVMEALPPTQGALLQHLKRAIYQASIWSTADQAKQQVPSPGEWGWTLDIDNKGWIPFWTTLQMAYEACSELVKCACKGVKGCTTRCSCKKGGWQCSKRCKCSCNK